MDFWDLLNDLVVMVVIFLVFLAAGTAAGAAIGLWTMEDVRALLAIVTKLGT